MKSNNFVAFGYKRARIESQMKIKIKITKNSMARTLTYIISHSLLLKRNYT